MMKFKIVGLGAIGTHLAFSLCNHGKCTELEIYDFDVVSKKDLGILPFYEERHIGKPKVIAFESIVSRIHPGIKLIVCPHRFPDVEIMEEGWIAIDCRDNKTLDIDFDFRISFDATTLRFDSRRKESIQPGLYKETNYLNKPDLNSYLLATAHCCEYIDERLFENQEFALHRIFKTAGIFRRR